MADNNWTEYLDNQAELLDKGVIDLKQYNDAVRDAKAGILGYSENLRKSTDQLKKSVLGLGSSMVEGKHGASVYNDSINSAANVIDSIASKFGFLGKVFGEAVTAGAKYVAAVNDQADKLYETYQDISRTGLATGMSGIMTDLQNMGYTIQELGKFSTLLKENADVMANFGGTAANGAKQFGLISRAIEDGDTGTELKRMGMTVDDISQGEAGYMRILQMSGALQKMTNDQLAVGAADYIKEQDRLTKLTGLAAKEQNKIYEQALADQSFGATQAGLLRRGEQEKYNRNKDLLLRFSTEFGKENGPEYSKAFALYASGMMTSDEAKKFQLSFPQAANAIKQGTATADQIMNLAHQDAKNNVTRLQGLAQAGAAEKKMLSYNGFVQGAQYDQIDRAEQNNAQAKKEQKDQQTGTDKQVSSMVKLTTAQRNQTQAMQKLINDGIGPVTDKLKLFTGAVEKITGAAGGVAGREGQIGGAGKGPPPTAPGGVTPDKVISFSGGTGDLAHFNQLQPAVYNGFLAMANDYYQQSGKKLQVNSAFRSIDEQKNVNSGANPKAAPGKSLHNQGKAIDINSSQVAELLSNGMLGKYGFSPLPGDPPHIQMPQAATGGILSGPQSGYRAMLHGTEAVVPMGTKKAITVNESGNSTEKHQLEIMSKKIATIDAIIRGMNRSNENNTQILRRMS